MNQQELIKGFLIFEKRSGRPFIHRTYPGFNADPFLLIGFLNAMIKFAKEAMIGSSDIRMIDMQDLRFAFMESHGIIFTAISTSITSPLDLEFKIKTIESLFLENFKQEDLQNPSLSIEHYNSFNRIVDEIVEGEVKYVPEEKTSIIKTILDDYKNKNEQIIGMAIISFTGIVIVNSLIPEHYNLMSKLINNLFSTRISGIKKFYMELVDTFIYVELISIDSYLICITKKKYLKEIEKQKFIDFKSKISELLRQN